MGHETHSPFKSPTPAPVSLFRTPMPYNFLLMETSTGFGAQDVKLHFTRSLSLVGFWLQVPAPGARAREEPGSEASFKDRARRWPPAPGPQDL